MTPAPYDTNTATLPDDEVHNAKNLGQEKETIDREVVVVWDARSRRDSAGISPASHADGFREAIDARWYMARRSDGASPVHCSVWVYTRDGRYLSGHGSAGGYGYHKASASLQAALDSAGIKLGKPIDGCGESAMRAAYRAILKAAGYGRCPWTVV